jgi:hypothetical protein
VHVKVVPREEAHGELIRVLSSVDAETKLAIECAIFAVMRTAQEWPTLMGRRVPVGMEHMILPGDWLSSVTILVSFSPMDVVPEGSSVGLSVALSMASWLTGVAARAHVVATGGVSLMTHLYTHSRGIYVEHHDTVDLISDRL